MKTIQAQSLPISSYGVWDRGGKITDFSKSNVDFVMGIEASAKWEDIEHVKGTFNFSSLQTEIDKAYTNNKPIRLSVEVGPDAPLWMYKGEPYSGGITYPQVEKVTTSGGNDKPFWPFYPEYLSQTYQDYLWIFLSKFSDFLRNQPQRKFSKIAFVQVKTGCTGDEVPFKGNVDNNLYDISNKDWYDFRLTVFGKYKQYFNDVPNNPIVLSFNNIDPSDPNEVYAWDWITTQIDTKIGFGIKGGAFNRGHHLSGEQSYKESLHQYLVNPKLPIKTFSASEMDGTTQDTYFQICEDMSYYWAALGGINVGLSTNNLNAVAMDYAINNPIGTDTFRMFTRYAQQVYAATATTAFSIFHDGLNSADTARFPEKDFGNTKATMDNTDRYVKICQAYASRGARMDDLAAVVQGQVYQRARQTGLNDAGWNIAEGNIERFFTQINPNDTSIGLFRVRGTITASSSKYDRFARSFENSSGKNTMYFKFDPEVFTNSIPKSLQFKIIWLDKTKGSTWAFKYKSPQGIKEAKQVTGIGDNNWKEETFTITDAIVDQSGDYGSDFTLVNTDTVDDIFNGIEVGIERTTLPLSVGSNTIHPADFISFFKQNEFKANINFNTNSKANIKLFNLNGSLMMSEDVILKAGNNFFSKTLSISSGVYIAVLKLEGKSISQKVIK
ncbi:T9SS type A sorting domain-containing protein [Flavobacterium luteum]|uniref:T9SS type A sorting domain-containing protein n=1 Tax=Flavobacterium luteum TaxID=2026654 RepID=UPI00177EB389|nr:T9SS type A sorting domain-containing protein [Flavobacterium luteum]